MSSSPETIGTPMKRCAGFKIGLSSRPSRRRISAIQFGFWHGGGAHAPDEHYLIEFTRNLNVGRWIEDRI